jgi:aconitate decarboxylase
VLPDPKIGGSFEKMSVEVVVTLRDGTSVERKCNAPDGSWSRPVAPERLERKARDLALPHLGERRFDAMMTIVHDDPSKISITQLMSLLGAPEK